MLKRITKVTSLLVTATSVISMVPAMAADVKKIDAIEGTVYQAKAEPGTTYLDAELNGEDEAIYAYKEGKYTKLNGADPGDTFGDVVTYEGKTYLEMAGGDYYVNVDDGERTDDKIKENIDDDADIALKKVLKADNDSRFRDDNFTGTIVKAETDHDSSKKLYGGATSRRYNYTLKTPFTYDGTYTKTYSAVFSDEKGNYIDADYNLGNMGVFNTTGASVTIKNTKDTYNLSVNGQDYEIKAEIQNLDSYTNDSNYITRTALLSIWGRLKGTTGAFSTNLTDKVLFGSSSNKHLQVTSNSYVDRQGNTVDCNGVRVMQKISKKPASDKVDGVKYANDVKTYFITDDKGTAQPLLGFNDTTNAPGAHGAGWITGGASGYIVSQFRDFGNKKQYAETINLKSTNGYNYTDVGDVDSVNVVNAGAFVIGAGDHYVLSDNGYIEEFIGKDSKWEKLYKVDGGMTNLSISLPMFAAVWNEDDKVYSIITPGGQKDDKGAATTDAKATGTTTAAAKAGWTKAVDGTWTFVNTDGTTAKGWKQDGATWYYLDPTTGVMATGWKNVGNTWYYLNASGAMQTGWVNDNGTWYYCNASGAMLANTTVDGYVLGANGAWIV